MQLTWNEEHRKCKSKNEKNKTNYENTDNNSKINDNNNFTNPTRDQSVSVVLLKFVDHVLCENVFADNQIVFILVYMARCRLYPSVARTCIILQAHTKISKIRAALKFPYFIIIFSSVVSLQ